MFATLEGTVDQARERRRTARRRELDAMRADEARKEQRKAQIVREAEDDDDWRDAGFASNVQWFMQLYACDYRTAQRIVRASEALGSLPAIDHALGSGELTLDQAIAVAEVATPETDAELARVAVGKPPSEISRIVRTIIPPVVADDQELYARRGLRVTWTGGRRELKFSGSLPLEQGAAFEQAIWNIAKPKRAADKKAGTPVFEWQQYAADALVMLATRDGVDGGGVKRSPTTLIVHLSDGRRHCSKALDRSASRPPNDSPATHAGSRSSATNATSCTHASHAAPPTRSSARSTSAQSTASTRAAPPPANSKRTTSHRSSWAARRQSTTSSCSAPAITPCFTTITSRPAGTAGTRSSPTATDARSPPTSHTHHPASRFDGPARAEGSAAGDGGGLHEAAELARRGVFTAAS